MGAVELSFEEGQSSLKPLEVGNPVETSVNGDAQVFRRLGLENRGVVN